MSRSKRPQLANPARRHFLAASAAVGKAAAATALGSAVLFSFARSPAKAAGRHNRPPGGHHHDPQSYLSGTRILTLEGERRIEDLRIGDLVSILHSEPRRVKWIGRNTHEKSGRVWSKSAIPIRVSRSVPVSYLVNGASALPAVPQGVRTIEYFQIVLDAQELVLAEGAASETFAANDKAAYEMFGNFGEYEKLYSNDPYTMPPLGPDPGCRRTSASNHPRHR